MKRLHFIGGKTAEITIVKEGRKWVYFTVMRGALKYRVDKGTGEVQVAPYWYTLKDLYVD